jgi:hypothetical protein
MISQVLNNLLSKIAQSTVNSEDQKIAIQGARQKLIRDAETFPCVRCENAGWLSTFETPMGGKEKEFLFTLSKCAGGVSLPQGEEQLGLLPPLVPFFCSSENQNDDARASGSSFIMPMRGRGTDETEKYSRPRAG